MLPSEFELVDGVQALASLWDTWAKLALHPLTRRGQRFACRPAGPVIVSAPCTAGNCATIATATSPDFLSLRAG